MMTSNWDILTRKYSNSKRPKNSSKFVYILFNLTNFSTLENVENVVLFLGLSVFALQST